MGTTNTRMASEEQPLSQKFPIRFIYHTSVMNYADDNAYFNIFFMS